MCSANGEAGYTIRPAYMGDESLPTPAPNFRLLILGAFCLERDGHVIRLPTRKAELLLAYLTLHPEPHTREKVAALFWADSPDELARRSLRTALASLRKELGESAVIADRETVQFNTDHCLWVDALQFQHQTTVFLADGSPHSAAVTFDLYRGELLADFYDDWILAERERLHELYLDALLRMTQRLREQSEYSRAIEIACKALAVDRANEQAHQHLMFCNWSLGDRNAALKQFEECKRTLHNELGVEPSQDTLALYERVKQANIAGPSLATANTNLPIPLTSFVGREQEMTTVKQLLGSSRLLTLTGVGGCGKTRLAIQITRDMLDQFPDGVCWVELAAAREDERMLQLVVKALGLVEAQQISPLDALLNHLRTKQILLVLDNCEHLVRACPPLAETILTHCPHVKILTTSREALSVSGEIAWLVPSLSLPTPTSDDFGAPSRLLQSESVRLFVERATAIRQDFALKPDHAPSVVHICRRLDGIPLAIEMAAARLKALTVEQIDDRLDDRFGLLTTGSRTALPRQQTLRATIDWSYELLSSAERTLLRRLSVFSGGWTLEAAEAICAGGDVERAQVLDLLTHLTEKSLVTAMPQAGETRFGMLETVRDYAREKLIETGEFEAMSASHLWFFSQLAQADTMRLRGEGQLEAFRRLETEYANLRVAFVWGLGRGVDDWDRTLDALRLATPLWHYWNMRGDYLEGYGWLQDAIEGIDALITVFSRGNEAAHHTSLVELQSLKATALFGQGILVWFRSVNTEGHELFESCAVHAQSAADWSTLTYARTWIAHLIWLSDGDLSAALAEWHKCEAYFRRVKDEWGVAWVEAFRGVAYRMAGACATARPHSQAGADIRRKLGDHWGWSVSLSNVGLISAMEGDFAAAKAELQPRLELGLRFGFKQSVVLPLVTLGHISLVEQDFERARVKFKQGLSLSEQAGMPHFSVRFLSGLARVSAVDGDASRAVLLFSAARASVQSKTVRPSDVKGEPDEQTVINNLRADMGEAAFQDTWAEGQAMTLEQAIEEAMSV